MPIIQGHILDGSTINTDGWTPIEKSYFNMVMIITEFVIVKMNSPEENVA